MGTVQRILPDHPECQAVWGKGQERVGGSVHRMSESLPFPPVGLDSGNGSEFINHHLYTYCQRNEITFTRSRPYKKNDNAHVEQKNWTVIRRLVGYDRDLTKAAYGRLQEVHRLSSLYTNFLSAGHEAEPAWCQGTQGVQHRQDTLPAANGAWCPVRRGARDPRSKVPDSKSRSAQGPTRRRPRGPVDHRRSTPRTPPLGNTFI